MKTKQELRDLNKGPLLEEALNLRQLVGEQLEVIRELQATQQDGHSPPGKAPSSHPGAGQVGQDHSGGPGDSGPLPGLPDGGRFVRFMGTGSVVGGYASPGLTMKDPDPRSLTQVAFIFISEKEYRASKRQLVPKETRSILKVRGGAARVMGVR